MTNEREIKEVVERLRSENYLDSADLIERLAADLDEARAERDMATAALSIACDEAHARDLAEGLEQAAVIAQPRMSAGL
jgi:hypothetical protein